MGIKINGLPELEERLEGIVNQMTIEQALGKAVSYLEGEAVKRTSSKEIQQQMSSKVDGLTGIVFNTCEYAPYVEYGTGLFSEHPNGGRKDVPWVFVEGNGSGKHSYKKYTLETAKRAMALLREKGLDAYYTYGQKPQPYLRPALDENRDKIIELLREGLLNND